MDNKFCKFYKWQKYVSYDNGLTWSPLNEYTKGELYESLSVDCGGGRTVYRWVLIDEYACEEVQDKYTYNFSNGDGIVIACGEGDVNINNKDVVTSTTVHNCVSNVPYDYARGFLSLEEAIIEEGITSIGAQAFEDCVSLTNVSMPNTIKTIGTFAFFDCYSLRNITLSENLETIKKGAFMDTRLSAVTIPNKVKKIGYAAGDDSHIVKNASQVVSTISKYEGVFENSDLITVTLNEGLEIIGARTFNYCSKLSGLTTPSTLKVLGYEGAAYVLSGDSSSPTFRYVNTDIGVLQNCTSLSSVTLNEGLEVIGNNAFRGCSSLTSVTIPSTVEAMYMNVFEGCSSLRYIISLATTPPPIYNYIEDTSNFHPFKNTNNCLIYVPDDYVDAYKKANVWSDVKERIVPLSSFNPSLGNKFEATYTDGTTYDVLCNDAEEELTQEVVRMHSNYKNIISARIGDCVTSIGNYAFSGCSSLTSCTIGSGVTSIGSDAFSNCKSLSSIEIPNSVTSIGIRTFNYCTSITSITIPNSVTSIGSSAFSNCSGLTSVSIGNSVTSISNKLFSGCTSLSSVTIGNNVTSIGDGAFYNSGIKNITIPNSVTSIGNEAFRYCKSLSSIEIPNSVTSIGNYAFHYCSDLASITVNAVTPPKLGSNAFHASNCPIYVPADSLNDYKTARGWSTYASRIRPLN